MSQFNKKKFDTSNKQEKDYLPKVEDVLCWPIATKEAIPHRNILDDTYEYFRVWLGYCEHSAKAKWVGFPVTKKGKLTGYILNNILATTEDEKWRAIGTVNTNCDLMGAYNDAGHRLGSSFKKKIYVAKGMYDYLSIYQTQYWLQKEPGKFTPSVVSITLGCPQAEEQMCNNHEYLMEYEQMITVFDGDENTEVQNKKGDVRGKEATEAVHMSYPKASWYVELAKDCDPNDYVARRNGLDPHMLNGLLWEPKLFNSANMSDAGEFDQSTLFDEEVPEGVYVPELPMLSKSIRNFRPNQLIVLLAPPKTGKTLITTHIHGAFIQAGLPTAGAYFEATKREMQQRFVCFFAQKDYEQVLFGEAKLSNEDIEEGKRLLKGHSLISLSKGRIKVTEMISMIRKEAINGKRLFVLDHASFIVEGANNERFLIGELMTELSYIKKEYPICIIVVAHITFDKKKLDYLISKHTDKDSKEWNESFWFRINAQDARGGSGFAQLVDMAICVDKEYVPGDVQGATQVKVAEARLVKDKGRKDILTLDLHTGRLKPKGREF